MKDRFALNDVPKALVAFAALTATVAALAQLTGPPPIKMGLWQTEATSTSTGMPNMPAGSAMPGPSRTITRGCLTPDSWKKDIEDFDQKQAGADCKISNKHEDAHGVTLDEICSSGNYSSTMHFEAVFDNDEHMHGSAAMHMSIPGIAQGMEVKMSMTSHYLGASCGDIKPGSTKVIHE